MNRIIISCNHFEITDSVKTFVNSKFSRLFHHYDDVIRIRVELDLDSGNAADKRFQTRTITELRGPDIVASAESENAYAALDAAFEKTERQLRHRVRLARYKRERVIHRMRRTARLPRALRQLAKA
ncbi:ribosome-associated translation inhibitor RaiA [Pelagicoccus sp. SDUM812005]|uniref:ribosome hibernation-promoting factor, HPF/YfiA family n=1 Tax=Pelagicoccus sp. SDUM812005 TaxID=3041257 RepID=UPI00280EDB50|nr:ribosome-associated translation inhibitor RaiA [Pelagicoccus sp. SDUM812005]MDQ8183124.1 ribosome-associated translation inhibitor RaiA [Pelagicoccus sp. SDUM812005]